MKRRGDPTPTEVPADTSTLSTVRPTTDNNGGNGSFTTEMTSVGCQTEHSCVCDYDDDELVPVAARSGCEQTQQTPFLLDSPAGSCDDDLLACQLFNDCLNPAIDIEVSRILLLHSDER